MISGIMHRATQLKNYKLTPFPPSDGKLPRRYIVRKGEARLLLYVVEYKEGFREIRAYDEKEWHEKISAFTPYENENGEQVTCREPIYWQKAPF